MRYLPGDIVRNVFTNKEGRVIAKYPEGSLVVQYYRYIIDIMMPDWIEFVPPAYN